MYAPKAAEEIYESISAGTSIGKRHFSVMGWPRRNGRLQQWMQKGSENAHFLFYDDPGVFIASATFAGQSHWPSNRYAQAVTPAKHAAVMSLVFSSDEDGPNAGVR